MGLVLSLAIYFVIWWLVLLAILPIGVKSQEEAGDIVPGTPESAPIKPRIAWKMGITTLVSALIFAVIYAIITLQIVTWEQFL